MAVKNVQAIGNYKAKKSLNGRRVIRTYDREYVVTVDSLIDCEPDVYAALPLIRSSLDIDPGAICRSVDLNLDAAEEPEQDSDNTDIWRLMAKVNWSSDPINNPQIPVWPYTPAKYSYGFDRRDVPVERDLDDRALQNTAGDPYNPPFIAQEGIPTETMRIGLLPGMFDPSWMLRFFLAVNDSAFRGWEAEQALIADIRASNEQYEDEDNNMVDYYALEIKFAYNKRGWQPEILSQGLREIIVFPGFPDGIKTSIYLPGGIEATTPFPLNEDGQAIYGELLDEGVFTKYKIFNKVSFADLTY